MSVRSRRRHILATGLVLVSPVAVDLGSRVAAQSTLATVCDDTVDYTRRFADLPALDADLDDLRALATAMMSTGSEAEVVRGRDPQENLAMPAGYTYFAQFVDHDLTSMTSKVETDPSFFEDLTNPVALGDLVNERTPELDLDQLYGAGPGDDARLYEADGMRLVSGAPLSGSSDSAATDLPRDERGIAIVADPRDDENRITAGVHALFIRLHNQTVDQVQSRHPAWSPEQIFTTARTRVVAAYQRVIARDLLPRLVGATTWREAVARRAAGDTCGALPVEFSVAAYRLGHSMVRDEYRLNAGLDPLPVFSGTFVPGSDLAGFSPSPEDFAIEWSLLLPGLGGRRGDLQWSYKIDASLTDSLARLPLPETTLGDADLALRNLARGTQVGLPSGQEVARALGIRPLSGDRLFLGAATGNPADVTTVADVAPDLAETTPLWAYVLAEAASTSLRIRSGEVVGARAISTLGPVGARLVADTFANLLDGSPGLSRGTRGPGTLSGLVRGVVTGRGV